MRARWVAVVIGLAIGAGCKRAHPPAPKVVPPTQHEAEAFAKELMAHTSPCDAKWFDEHFDLELTIARAVAGRKLPRMSMPQLRESIGGERFCADIANTQFAYLRTRLAGDTPQPLFRVLHAEGAVNYVQLELDKRTGPVRIADTYNHARGELQSDTLRTIFEAGARTSGDVDMAKAKRFTVLVREGNHAEALALLRTFPPGLRETKPFRLLEITSLSALPDDRAYLDAIGAFERSFPDDASMALVAIDGAFLRKDFKRMIALLDQLDRRLGGDPYLDVMRASALSEQGQHAEAVAAARRATAGEPTLEIAWTALMIYQIAVKDFAGALATLEVLRDRFEAATDAESLRTDPRFAPLAESTEYAAWTKKQP